MEIRMTADSKGADGDGITVKRYYAGQTYTVGDSLGRAFVEEMRVAVAVTPEPGPTEVKPAPGPDENKPARRPRRALGDE